MSKLYKKYVLLKINNPNKIYLFECGIFYIFIHEDAFLMADLLKLKLTPLNPTIMKCGFPIKSADKYLKFLKNSNYDIEIVPSSSQSSPVNLLDFSINQGFQNIIHDFLAIDVNELSISQAFELLNNLHNKFKKIELENNNEKKK